MKGFSFNSEFFFPLALVLSVGIHGAVIASTGLIPASPEVSVINAPNSLEINIITQPLVSVLEEEIITEEIIEEEISQEIVFNSQMKEGVSESSSQSLSNSQESRGAITKAKPLMQANAAPAYPRIARQNGWEGTVKLTALIKKDGIVDQINVAESSGYRILDKEALNTVKKWKFSPARSGSARFSSRISIPIRFDLIKE